MESNSSAETRMVQIGCLLQEGEQERARRFLDLVLVLQPGRADELRRWFDALAPRPR